MIIIKAKDKIKSNIEKYLSEDVPSGSQRKEFASRVKTIIGYGTSHNEWNFQQMDFYDYVVSLTPGGRTTNLGPPFATWTKKNF